MNRERQDHELAAAVRQAFPAPPPAEVDRAWQAVAVAQQPGRRPAVTSLARAAGLAGVIGASFAAGYLTGRLRQGMPNATTGQPLPADSVTLPVRPPELLPASAVGGVT